MTNYLLLIYPLLLLVVTFWGCKVSTKGTFSEELWNARQMKNIQAIACIGVVFHHVTQLVTSYGVIDRGPITVFSSIGILFTSIFFFSSGYGLIYQVRNNPKYLDHFLSHRIPIILVPFFLINVIYILVRIYYHHIPMETKDILKCFFGLVLLQGHGWYIVEIFILYIVFFVSFKLIKKQDIAMVILCAAAIWMIVIGNSSGHDNTGIGDYWFHGEWWYNSTIVFVMGVLFARFTTQIQKFTKRFYKFILPISLVLFYVAFQYEEKIMLRYGYYSISFEVGGTDPKLISLYAQMILCVVSTWVILLLNMKIAIGNRMIQYISMISTELFLIHGLFINTFFDWRNVSIIRIYAIVLVCGVAAAILIHLISNPLVMIFQDLFKGKDYLKDCEKDLFRERREKKKKIMLYGCLFVFVGGILFKAVFAMYERFVRDPKELKEEVAVLRTAEVGDEVYFGRFDTNYLNPGEERVTWIVLQKQDGKVMLISKEGLKGSSYNQKHAEVDWQDSTLWSLLNNDMFTAMFSNDEMDIVIPNPETNDYLSVLSVSEAETLFADDVSRELGITKTAWKEGTNQNELSKANGWDLKGYRTSWWWLRGDTCSNQAPVVTVDGVIDENHIYVNRSGGAVRPVVWVVVD